MERMCCAFAGHRPKFFPWGYDESDSRCIELKTLIAHEIGLLVSHRYTDFLSGMALGVDVWAAETILVLREEHAALKLHCILPCIGQEKSWSDEAKVRYFSIIESADSRVYASRKHYKNCMLDRNRFMVDKCDLLFAVYNGVSRCGTASTIHYARTQKREILILDPLTKNVIHETPQ